MGCTLTCTKNREKLPLAAAAASSSSMKFPNKFPIITASNGALVDLSALTTPGTWLNDEHVNAYLELVQQKRGRGGNVLLMSTHFLTKLLGPDGESYEFDRVRRWTSTKRLLKKTGTNSVFNSSLESVLVPVHAGGMHWWLCAVDLKNRNVHCLDSARDGSEKWDVSRGSNACKSVVRWLVDVETAEMKQRRCVSATATTTTTTKTTTKNTLPTVIASERWKVNLAPHLAPQRDPKQSGDCGVFVCVNADWWATAAFNGKDLEDVSRYSTLRSKDMHRARIVVASLLLAEHRTCKI